MTKISIIIPMFNVAQYMDKCLKSVYNQELAQDEFEVIIVNDGSSDNSVEVAHELTESKSNVTIISQENKGLGGARNTGIINATGIYLLFLDADDWLLPNVLSDLVAEAVNENLDFLEFAAQGVDSNGKITYYKSNKSALFDSGFEYYNSVRYMNSACNKLYKRTFLIENQIFFKEKIYIEDFEFNTRVLSKVKRVKATNQLIAQFLQTSNSITRNTSEAKKQKMVADIILVIKETETLYKQEVKNDTIKRFYLERLNFLVATLFYQLIKNKADYQEVKKLKEILKQQDLFYIDHTIFDSRKNIMRIVLLKNLWLYKCIKLIQ